MSKFFISIVSHHNDEDIMSNESLLAINAMEGTHISIRDNVSSSQLRCFCEGRGLTYASSTSALGFGGNNNKVFYDCVNKGMKDDDWFILMNPDVIIGESMMCSLREYLSSVRGNIFAINLFSNYEKEEMEFSLRRFPSFISLLNVFNAKSICTPYDKSKLDDGAEVDWAAGSFLVFRAGLYKKIGGFDEKYFMYFEDVDLCYRANKILGERVRYLKSIHAYHKGGYQNRKVFSPHFRWYIRSLIRFLFKTLSRS
ncbi:MAG: glycosyltransferase family 2 protein [Colwellia sp.]